MDEKIIQEKVVSALLQEPVRIWVTIEHQNILHKLRILPRRKAYLVKPAVLATMVRISREILKLTDLSGVENEKIAAKLIENAESNVDALTNILSLAIHNRREYPSKRLKDFLMKNLTVTQMLQVIVMVVTQIDVQSFTTTITLIKGVSLLKTRELIAFGEQSEASRNTSVSA
jgi:hypothetical protein